MIYKCTLIPLITQGCIIWNVFKLCFHQYVPIGVFFKPKPKTMFVFDIWLPYFFCIGVGQYMFTVCVWTQLKIYDNDCHVFYLQNSNLTTHLTSFLGWPKKFNYIFFLLISIKCFYVNCNYWPCAIQHVVRTSGTGKTFDAKIVN